MLLLLLLAAAAPGDVLETRLETAVHGEGSLEASVSYRVVLFEEIHRLPLVLLEVGGARVESIEALASGGGLTLVLEPSDSPQRRGYVEQAEPFGPEVELRIRYTVSGAVQRDGDGLVARVPIPVIALPPRAARAEAFAAALALPPGTELIESFPAGLAQRGDVYAGSLPLVPAFLFARLAPGGTLVTLERGLDWGVLALLGGLGAFFLKRGLGALSQ